MRVISVKKLRDFWQSPGNAAAEVSLRAWYRTVKHADWENFADVKATYGTADQVKKSRKVVFDIGGNKFRLIAVIDYARHKVFVRAVMDHKEYDRVQDQGRCFSLWGTLPTCRLGGHVGNVPHKRKDVAWTSTRSPTVPADPDQCRLPAPLLLAGCLCLASVPFAGLCGLNLLLGGLAHVFGCDPPGARPGWLLWADAVALVALGLVGGAGWLWLCVLVGWIGASNPSRDSPHRKATRFGSGTRPVREDCPRCPP
jgi:mRNA interferase HigB